MRCLLIHGKGLGFNMKKFGMYKFTPYEFRCNKLGVAIIASLFTVPQIQHYLIKIPLLILRNTEIHQ